MEPGVPSGGQGDYRCLGLVGGSNHKQGPGTGLASVEGRGQSRPMHYGGGRAQVPELMQSPEHS
jgi:hypothetical protein